MALEENLEEAFIELRSVFLMICCGMAFFMVYFNHQHTIESRNSKKRNYRYLAWVFFTADCREGRMRYRTCF
jgi:hypothetical protein